MTHIDLLASGKLAIEFQPKYHDRAELRQILRTVFPNDFNYDGFDTIEPIDDINGSVWFYAHMEEGEITKEWTFSYYIDECPMDDVIVVPMDKFKFGQLDPDQLHIFNDVPETINAFLEKYGN